MTGNRPGNWLGTFLLLTAVILILIPLQGAGTLYAWDSPTAISLFIVGGLFLAAFAYVEGWVVSNPVIPFSLVRNVYVVGTFAMSLCIGMSFFVLVFYAPLWFQVVFGGIRIIPLIVGVVLFSILTGVVAGSTGLYMPFLPFGGVFIAIGAGLLSTLDATFPLSKQILYLFLAGIGVGACVQTDLLAAQATIGAVLGLAIVSTVFNNRLATNFGEKTFRLRPGITPDVFLKSVESVRKMLPPDQQGPIIHAYVRTLSLVFLITVPFAGLLVVASFFVKKERLPTDKREMVVAA
ncbi:hypothetical protein HDU96_004313 [Phlyctochytrium bullatum]|nr:hypothetical protein HDU96_004313 [Phlyctochytrium bullatum]